MQEINAFIGGMHSDNDVTLQPKDTYKRGLNFIRTNDGVMHAEEGTTSITNFPSGMNIIGHCTIGDDTVLFLTNDTDSEIGVLSNDSYSTYLNTTELAFNTSYGVEAEGRVDFQGHKIVYFCDNLNPMRRLDLDDIPTTNIGKKISLLLNYNLPKIEVTDVIEQGELKSGVVQFAVRLVTETMNATPFSLLTNFVPIAEGNKNAGRHMYDGASPGTGTNKSVKLKVSNIDTDYKYVEVCVIVYNDILNTQSPHTISLQPIQGRDTIEITYVSESQHKKSLTIDEVTQDFAHYDKAKCVAQKDGILFFSNLKSTEENINFQAIANKIGLRYTIKEVPYLENVVIKRWEGGSKDGEDIGSIVSTMYDYKDPMMSVTSKGYQRGEVYSFAFVPIFKGRKFGHAYHIPGIYGGNGSFMNNVLDSYLSVTNYPDNLNYPREDGTATRVRHHRFPGMDKEPIIRVDGNNTYLRIMGVEAFNVDIPSNIKDKLEGYILVRQRRTDDHKSILAQGIGQYLYRDGENKDINNLTPFTGDEPYWTGFDNTRLDKKKFAFLSPETVIYEKDLSYATQLQSIGTIEGTLHTAAEARGGYTPGDRKNLFGAFVVDYSKLTGKSSLVVNGINKTQYIPKDDLSLQPHYDGSDKYSTADNYGYLLLHSSTNFYRTKRVVNPSKGEVFWDDRGDKMDDIILHQMSIDGKMSEANAKDTNFKGVSQRDLYNLKANRVMQYGEIFDATYIQVQDAYFSEGEHKTLSCFGGDIFVTKFAVSAGMRQVYGDEIEDIGLLSKTINYFWCESEINCNYRHSDNDTVPYYPNSRKLWTSNGDGIMQISSSLGHPRGYNKQYSFENTTRPFFPKLLGQIDVTDHSNRTIYSEKGIEGEQHDSFRVFLSNNYHDIPRDRGEIVDTFIMSNTLFLHTEQSLFRTYVNERTTQATSSGDVVLGNGGLFPMPSSEIMTIDGGYAGTESTCGVTTPFGRIFVDNRQKKVFMYSDQLTDISDIGLNKYFLEHIGRGDIYTATYDYTNERYILSGFNAGHPSISFRPKDKTWVSYHSYNPSYLFHHGVKVYGNYQSQLCLFGGGERGKFFGQDVQPCELDVIVNPHPGITKVYDNIVLQSTEYFDSLECINTDQYSGIVNLTFDDDLEYDLSPYQLLVRRKSNQWQLCYPRSLDDDGVPTARLRDKYVTCKWVYNNSDDRDFRVKYIGSIFRGNAR